MVVTCPSCQKKNRVDPSREGPKCGACGAALGGVTELDDASFRSFIIDSPLPVLVDFSAEWCGPCRMVAPLVYELALEKSAELRVAKVDIDRAPGTAQKFGVTAVPTLLLLRGPRELARQEGALPGAALRAWVEQGLLAGSRRD
jgi:thioredoxin 2